MATKCGFCKGTGKEEGFDGCAWCCNTGLYGGIQPVELKKALGDDALLRSALEHIFKTVGQSRTQTRRLRWIGKRAELALAGRPYVASEHELPVNGETEHFKLLGQKSELKGQIVFLEQRLARLTHAAMELTGVIDEYRAMPVDSLKTRMFQTADRYRKRIFAKCSTCEDNGVIGYTTGQTPETFE